MTLLASSLATARAPDLASRRQQMTPPPRASAGDGYALLMLLLLLSQPLLLLSQPLLLLLYCYHLPPSREATAVGEPSRAEPILKPCLPVGGPILPPQ